MLDDGSLREVDRAIWMVLVVHLIGRSEEADGSKDEGLPEATQASIANNARIGFGRRIRVSRIMKS
jgi:hypothetical protein